MEQRTRSQQYRRRRHTSFLDRQILVPAIRESFLKLEPRWQARNPVMFVVEVGSVITTIVMLVAATAVVTTLVPDALRWLRRDVHPVPSGPAIYPQMVLHRLNVWHLPLISGISLLRRPEIVACVRAACGRESFPATRRLRCWGPYRVGQSAGRPATHKGRPGAKPSGLCDELPGLKRAVAQGVKLGRPKIDSETERKVRKYLAKGCGHLGGGEVTRHRDGHGAAHLKGAGNEPARGAAMTSGPQLTNSLARLTPR